MSQNLCNILAHVSLQCVYHMIEVVQAIKGAHYGW